MNRKEPKGDYIVRATAYRGAVRAFACRTTALCREAVRLHQLSPVSAAALGRLMSGALMLAHDLKESHQSITAIVRGDGPMQGMTVVAQGDATVRGLVIQPVVETRYARPGKLDVGSAVGRGTLTIIRDLGLKEPYTGTVQLVSGEIAEDLTYYLATSEQTPSAVSLGVRMGPEGISQAGGLIVQLMPAAGESVAERLEQRVVGFPDVSSLMDEGFDPHQLLDLLLGDPEIQYLSTTPCSYACPCSTDRMRQNLTALGRAELTGLASDPDGIELQCHFCGQSYHFNQDQVQDLLDQAT
ncbi:MAG: Hsp33 family molecular chaperone HslO [Saccharofermentanales bacterium]|jgi:molecular chaperone Hsp33|nr:Hsp33 family molecular chaperone HslO [Clostridiaceae bacterium]